MFRLTALAVGAVALLSAAQADRITSPIDSRHVQVVAGNLARLAKPQFDQGPADPAMRMPYIILLTKPTAAQQADLDRLLADQQNPSSKDFRHWLAPEQFADRFGLSPSDHAKIAGWLKSEGFTVQHMARGRNWIAFTGTAAQVAKTLHTSVHQFLVNGEKHYAITTEPSVPDALSGVVAGFIGLHDFRLTPAIRRVHPAYTSGSSHYLAPQDFATIYDITPLAQAGIDGTGTSIAVVGASDYEQADLSAFTKRYGLPAENPTLVPYDLTNDPGINGALIEVDLDLEWSHAIAPGAQIYYVYGVDPFAAIVFAVSEATAPILTSSYLGCEADFSPFYYRSIAQQANAQGMTLVNAAGDAGAAGCDFTDPAFATQGMTVAVPAALPEVTAIGGTQFVEGSGTYWGTNSSSLGSALSYIPETTWNESSPTGIGAGGGGASIIYPRPAWQNSAGVPNDNARHLPDVSFSAAQHDGYEINYFGLNVPVAGTSAGTPSFAGVLALLNHYLINNGALAKPGLGNINPQLYHLAQAAPTVFHDIQTGNNIVPCQQGSPDCLTGSFGYTAAAGYDMATGLGSIDVNALATNWNSDTSPVTVNLAASGAKIAANAPVQLTATVVATSGSGTPTGIVSFSQGATALGTATVGSDGTASISFPAYTIWALANGSYTFYAQYSGDAAFSSGGATAKVQVTTPAGAATIIPSAPDTVWPSPPDAQGLAWPTGVSLREISGVAAMLTGFTLDGQSLPLAQYFPQTTILPRGTLSSSLVLRNVTAPMTHALGFSGVDANGQNWSVQVNVLFNRRTQSAQTEFLAAPLIVSQDTTRDPSCQWPVQLHLDDVGGYFSPIDYLETGSTDTFSQTDISAQIVPVFGTSRLAAYASLSGTLCFGGITPPATQNVSYILDTGQFGDVTVVFTGPPTNPIQLSAAPATLALSAAPGQTASTTLAINLSDPSQQWTASIFPANRTSSWLSLSQLSGVGPAQIIVNANGAGFEPGAYQATILLQSANTIPQTVAIPVMMVYGGSTTGTAISSVANAASASVTTGAPGMQLTVTGTQLSNASASTPGRTTTYPFTLGGVTATLNDQPAPIISVAPGQVVLQIPYEIGAGSAVVGINNNGQIAGFQFQMAASAPAIYDDGKGNLAPTSTAKAGATATVLINGAGDYPLSSLGLLVSTGTLPSSASLFRPALPVAVTVGGTPAFLSSVSISGSVLGETQVSFIVPAGLTPGPQPVVVTVGGVASQAVNLTITP